MKDKRQKREAEAPRGEAATPFFARYLEGQAVEPDAEAKVGDGRRKAEARAGAGGAKKSAKKAAKKSTKKSTKRSTKGAAKSSKAKAVAQTLKYPSDGDEIVFLPYTIEAAQVTNGFTAQTLKYPSDLDELVTQKYPSDGDDDVSGFYALYANAADAPNESEGAAGAAGMALSQMGAALKAGNVRLSKKPDKG